LTASVFPDDYSGKPFVAKEFAAQEAEAKAASAALALAAASSSKPASDAKAAEADDGFLSGVSVVGLAVGILAAPLLAKRFKGMSVGEVIATVFEWVSGTVGVAVELIGKLLKKLSNKKAIPLPDK
jgi:hypothetical protein